MKLTLRLMIGALLASAVLPAAAANWADDKASFPGQDYTQSKVICRGLKGLSPPPVDQPDRAAAAALKGCSSEGLYYGIGVSPDPVRARQCAFVERASGTDSTGLGGDAMLMTIYANGVGAARNLALALALACRLNGAPAEEDGRVKHLAALKAQRWTGHDFSFCDDITSGYAEGLCAAHDATLTDAKRNRQFASVTAGWSAGDKRAFTILQQAENGFVAARTENEVDQSGTARAALAIDEQESLEQDFLGMLRSLAAGKAPTFTAAQFAAADAALNQVYQQVQHPGKDWGTVTTNGIRTAQRAWLKYRDAWVAFAKIKYPAIASDSVLTWLTQKRTTELQNFLS